jgi:hypothetical protein
MTAAKKTAYLITAVLMAVYMALFLQIIAEASTCMYAWNAEGNIYISETGWIRIGNDTYYVHETKSRMYDRYEACRNAYRWRGAKLYYFGNDGKMAKHSTQDMKLSHDHSVRYIYTQGAGHRERYNAKLHRYQIKVSGTWHTVGNETFVWWMCDWQP